MKRALITGAHGFIGRHLSRRLAHHGIDVSGIGYGSWTESERITWGIGHWLEGDVSKKNLDTIQGDYGKLDVIFHLAGGSSVGKSFVTPEDDFRRSVLSTFELLEWARLFAQDVRLVFSSSAAVYGAGHTRMIIETDELSPYSPYGVHKRIAEELIESYGNTYGLNVAVIRLFSVYGPELRKQLLWDSCCRLAVDSSRLVLGGTGVETRDWLHVSDATTLLQLAATNASPKVFLVNGGTGVSVSVQQVAEQLCLAWGSNTQVEFSGMGRTGDPHFLVADMKHANAIGFQPRNTWQAGVSEYVNWFRTDYFQVKP